jgi:ADP-ribose pyrophosphatase
LGLDGRKPTEVELEKTEVLADGFFRFERLTLRTGTFSGELSGTMQREILRSGRAVVVLLYDPVGQQLILIEQFRIGAYLNHLPSAWLLECVAGRVDEGETDEAAARRETKEETGCQVGRIEKAGVFLSSPGISDELITIYVAEVDAIGVGGIHGKEGEGEDIRVVLLTVDEALAAADSGGVVNVVSQVALLWFARHGEALRQRWLGAAA